LGTNKKLVGGILAFWLFCSSDHAACGQELPPPNWETEDAPCAKYDDLRKADLGDIGVRIDGAEPWAKAFRRALAFWNGVLHANFHEERSLNGCAVRIVNGGKALLKSPTIARAQLPDRGRFFGKIAVSSEQAKGLTSAEIYAIAVHEIGHILRLSHNTSAQSVMFSFGLNGTEILDNSDLAQLATRHVLRAEGSAARFVTLGSGAPNDTATDPNKHVNGEVKQTDATMLSIRRSLLLQPW
jgi:hypothetical protein